MIKKATELLLLATGFLAIASWPVAVALAGWISFRYLVGVKRAVDNLRASW